MSAKEADVATEAKEEVKEEVKEEATEVKEGGAEEGKEGAEGGDAEAEAKPEAPVSYLSERAVECLRTVFYVYDESGDNQIDWQELTTATQYLPEGFIEMLKSADKDADAKISMEEWLGFFDTEATAFSDEDVDEVRSMLLTNYFTVKHSPKILKVLEEIYNKFDDNKDGRLTFGELREHLKGNELSAELFTDSDIDGDSTVSYQEWLAFFKPIPDNQADDLRECFLGLPIFEKVIRPRPCGRRSALVVVGLQNDFISGSRAVPKADTVIPLINSIREKFEWDAVVMTKNLHASNDISFLSTALSAGQDAKLGDEGALSDGSTYKLLTSYCVEGTAGVDVPPELVSAGSDHTVVTGSSGRPSFSAFRDLQPDVTGEHMTGLNKYLRNANVTDVYVVGLGLEDMALQTAKDANTMGFATSLVTDACLEWSTVEGGRCRIEAEQHGIQLLTTDVLLETTEDTRTKAQLYVETHGLQVLMSKLTAALVFNMPDDPREFLANELKKLRIEKQQMGRLNLLTVEDLDTMFDMLDPVGRGVLTGKQIIKGLEGLPISPNQRIDQHATYDPKAFKRIILTSS